jgi:hypothetical protein
MAGRVAHIEEKGSGTKYWLYILREWIVKETCVGLDGSIILE